MLNNTVTKFFNYIDYLRLYFKLIKPILPTHITFFVTGRCNLRCKMCFYWQNIANANFSNELKLDEIEKISQNFKDIVWLSLTGGEPFIRTDIDEIIKIFYRNNKVKNVSIYTNGFFTQRTLECVKSVLSECKNLFLTVNISIDGINEVHDSIRGVPGSFKKALTTLKELEKLKSVYKNFCLGVVFTMSSLNQDKFFETFNFLDREVKFDTFYVNYTRGNAMDPSTKNFSTLRYIEAHQFLKKKIYEGRIKQHGYPFSSIKFIISNILTPQFIVKIKNNQARYIKTRAGRVSIVIDEYGNVWPSELISKKLGNLREVDYDIKKIMYSEVTRQIIDEIKNTNVQHECNIVPDLLTNFSAYPFILREFLSYKLKNLVMSRVG